ncbi:ribonucleoside-diphosphate reductase subunit alpha [Streptomyces rapamycinicus]|uniref:Ribonucleoside-diphosphate reductase n=2 Tax=Streptomyces rapamycinicus TaxID=1226757 RepID=A0A0A0NGB9_STRRN|nr:ribonucleoside-diphosphate reductase subunit alpha [Streptomyces rapamycinicus]AGP55118.1 ribonucleoside-diphosphate reductase [Streptomyces rapamycinicus NRRL 5491]MBB4782655.1 ribonucleoside-diphosphate reductase alpha chain [Streptomyces rapamycinicus]RLV81865.1 ribonucleoside-diphosphate reductase subunit alpha [Streptomyces rapamycinicus NRRL 5491]UTO63142.1 ribonucleoside-diphosphate reductase subunit alpha [Streptomyces rapamycinicus]UTP31100.1 ribonucleoside-diphosphate reductase su
MTIAPADPVSAQAASQAADDAPGTALLRTLTGLTADLPATDPGKVAAAALRGRHPGSDEAELRALATEAAAGLIAEEPEYSRLAARLLALTITEEAAGQGAVSFSASVRVGHREGLLADSTAEFAATHAERLDALVERALADGADNRFGYFGLRTLYSRYLLRHPITRQVIETPQHFLLRVACGLAEDHSERALDDVAELYRLTSTLSYLPSSPTLFNSGTRHPQMSSCYLLDSPLDELDSIYNRYHQVARLSKHAGGIGLSYSRIRARGSLIRGTNGHSNGIVPFLRTLDASVAAVNQGGRRKGAACVYLETWHADLEEFLELRDNTGEDARRTHNLNIAHWIPDEFMRRVEADADWSLFSPADAPDLVDLWGEEFDAAYRRAEAEGKAVKQVPARQLYARMMRTLAQTGNGWMTFKDAANRTANQTAQPGRVVHSSNLCTEILEVTDDGETAVCNLGSVNLAAHLGEDGQLDWERLDATVHTAVTFLDRVVDINFYPTEEAGASNSRWRPVGLGLMGLQDVFFRLRLPFDSPEATALSTRISERIMLAAYEASCELAERHGPHPAWAETRTARGVLHPDHYTDAVATWPERWEALRTRMAKSGMRNSLLLAIAPTATIASIAGVYECIEPQVSNLFKRETLSGEFLQVNSYLVDDLKKLGVWDAQTRAALRESNGSVQDFSWVPADVRELYRTAWEVPQRALIDMAAARTPYLDQSQSLNLFMASPTIGKLSSMYAYAWKRGIKTTYYLRSRPATRIAQSARGGAAAAATPAPTVPVPVPVQQAPAEADAIACSLENPESCEACQ